MENKNDEMDQTQNQSISAFYIILRPSLILKMYITVVSHQLSKMYSHVDTMLEVYFIKWRLASSCIRGRCGISGQTAKPFLWAGWTSIPAVEHITESETVLRSSALPCASRLLPGNTPMMLVYWWLGGALWGGRQEANRKGESYVQVQEWCSKMLFHLEPPNMLLLSMH